MTAPAIGPSRAVEVLHDRGPAAPTGGPRWTSGSGYLIGSRLVLTAAHNVDYRRDLGADEQLLVRMIEGSEQAAQVVLVGEEQSRADLAVLEITDPRFGEHLPPVTFAGVDRDSPVPVTECWAVGFPRFGEAEPVLPEGSRRETWHVRGDILPGAKLRAGLLSLQVTINPPTSLTGSAWEGMSGAVVFAADAHDDEQAAVGVISTHHRPEGESALTVVPVTAVAELAAAAEWWQQFGVPGPGPLPVLPHQRARAGLVQPASAAGRPLAEVTDPFVLEVHRPVQPEHAPAGLPVLPPYVPREHDRMLGQVVRAAAEGRSGIAVLVGGSSTGKTRACWEALAMLRDQDPPWRLWHPIDPSRPDAALRELPGIGPRTVVWLNEAQFYLDPAEAGLGEEVAAGLGALLCDPARGPVLVLATLWPDYWLSLTARPPGGEDRHPSARGLLDGHDIPVPKAFTPAQMNQLAGAADARMALAARSAPDGAVIQFLAGAPELLARYRHAPPAAAALIDAAMDARRLGMGAGLPQAFLEAAAPGYLTDAEWDGLGEDWLEQALAYAAVPCKGARGPLTRIRLRLPGRAARDRGDQPAGMAADAGLLYRLADYLDQHGRAHRASQIPPPEFWSAAAAHAAPDDQAALGDAAHRRGLYRDAAQLHKNAAASGNTRAVSYLCNPAACLSADPRSMHWVITHVSLGDPHAVAALLGELREAGAQDQVTALLRRDPVAHAPLHNPHAVALLLDRLREAGAQDQVTALLRRDPAGHAPLDKLPYVAVLLAELRRAGAYDQVTALAARVAAHAPLSDPRAVAALLRELREAGAKDQVTALLRRDPAGHAPLEYQYAVAALLRELREAGAKDQLTALLRRDPAGHAPLGDPHAVAALLRELREAGAKDQVTALLRRDPAAHAPLEYQYAVAALLRELREAGAQDQVTALATRAAAHAPLDDPHAVAALLRELREAGAQDQVTALATRAGAHAPLDDPHAVAALLRELREAGAQDQVTALATRAAAHAPLDNPRAVALLVDSMREAGAQDQVTALLRRDPAAHAPLDNPRAVALLVDRLREAGAQDQVAALATRAAAHAPLDDPHAVATLLRELQEAGAQDQVTALLRRDPAVHAPLDDPHAVALLVDSMRETGAQDQVTALATRAAAHAPLENQYAVARLVEALRAVSAQDQVTVLATRLPEAGLFELFRQLEDRQNRFRFGREADGSPSRPWGWDDLD